MRRWTALALLVIALLQLAGVSLAEEKVGYVTSTGLYIRKSPSADAEVLRCAANGEKLTILKEEGSWYYVKYNYAVSGYVAKKYVSLEKTSSSSSSSSSSSASSSTGSASQSLPSKVADLGDAPSTSRVGDRGADVKKLQQALKILGHYTGSCDGIFGENTENAVKKFQKSRGLSQDGIAGKVTIELLFGEKASNAGASGSSASTSASSSASSSKSKTEKLDWSTASSVIPKGGFFILKDVRTGKTLKCKHLYGSSHLDAEPATKEDTAKLLEIYGGSWSWRRRPVLISYGGRILAASMNGMPHGEQSITDNNFDGQFCIHFLNSKTHGSAKVDSDHQACVNEAAKASW